MNWLDFTLIVILAIGLVVGLRIGILGAVYCTIVGTMGASNAVDRIGGLIVGIALGTAVSGALLVGIMGLTYGFDSTDVSVREDLETALLDSTFVPMFVQGAYTLPGDSLGLIPGGFQASLEALRDSIE